MSEEFPHPEGECAAANNSASDSGEETGVSGNADDSILAAIPVVRKIVRRRLAPSKPDETSDVEQGIILRLLNRFRKDPEKSARMSEAEWGSYAARTAYNETNRFFSALAAGGINLSLETAGDIEDEQKTEGDSETEFRSLVARVWQEICLLSVRRRRALLLHSRSLIVYLLRGGVSDDDLARSLEISDGQWREIKARLPLSDAAIANLFEKENRERGDAARRINSIKKARHEARAKLKLSVNK